MEKHKVTKIYSATQSKAGKKYETRDGKPYTRVALQTDRLPVGVWASANVFKQDDPILRLKQGDVVDLRAWQEGEWWNFKLPTKFDRLEERVAVLEKFILGDKAPTEIEEVEVESDEEELPF